MAEVETSGTLSRRRLLAGAAAAAGGALALGSPPAARGRGAVDRYPFHGLHQGGVTTEPQANLLFAAFDVTAASRAELRRLLRGWCEACARMCEGQTAAPLSTAPEQAPADTGEALSLRPARLTLTIGLGPSLFDARFGLGGRRPPALVELPAFRHDRLDPARSGGDLCVQACADDPQVAFHAIRNLARAAQGSGRLRWTQAGFSGSAAARAGGSTARNLMGFKDGSNNLDPSDTARMDANVWVGGEGPAWMRGGTYLVVRRIRIAIERWDASDLYEQERSVGRSKLTGAPLGERHEFDPVDPARLPSDCHIILANPRTGPASERERLLRRGYSFSDGQAADGRHDAGLFFACFQRDPRRQFVSIERRLAAQDALAEYLLHTGSGIYAVPPGCAPGGYVGERLFDP